MKTYVINKIEELEQFRDECGYKVDGNLEIRIPLTIEKSLFVAGFLYIEAGWYIKAGGSIKAGWSIEAGEYIKAGWSIEAGEYIKAGGYIEAGESYGISAGLQISCKDVLKFGLKCFAGICTWREITDEDKTIICGKLEGGTIEYGILKETGITKNTITVTCNGKSVEISRESAVAMGLTEV